MKILQVSHKYPFPPKDGGSLAMISLADGFARAGHEVSLIAMRTPKHGGKIDKSETGYAYHKVYTSYVNTTLNPFRLLSNLLFSILPYNAVRFINQKFRDKLTDVLLLDDYDIVQLEGLYLMPYTDTIRKYSGARIVLRAHNVEHEVWNRMASKAKNMLKRAYLKILARRMNLFETSFMNQYDLLVPISERDRCVFVNLGNQKPTCVIPFGMDVTGQPPLKEPAEKNALFYIGSLDYMPNQEGLIWFIEKVWKNILCRDINYVFYIAGRNAPGHLRNYLKKQPVIFMGEIEDAYHYMQTKGIMVVPVLSGGGIRIRIVEAMALGIPVVSTSTGAEGLDVSDGMNIMIADDPEIFSKAVVKLLENQTFFANIGKNARIFVREKMNSVALAAELLNFYMNNL
ncbi:MAG: glycosyltransferase family 4 protein [Bacteroidales bacterium]|nr:glycosyltransferase family 4 protein [Bacteroidales bacterium]